MLGLLPVVEGIPDPTDKELRWSLLSVIQSINYKKFNKNKDAFEQLRSQLHKQGKNVKINKKKIENEYPLLLYITKPLVGSLKEGILPELIRWLSTLAKKEGDELDLSLTGFRDDTMYWITTQAHHPVPLLQELCSINKKNKNKIDVNRLDSLRSSPIEQILSRKDLLVKQKIACIRILHEIAKDNKQEIDEKRRKEVEKIVYQDKKIDENQKKRLIDTVYPNKSEEVNVNNIVDDVNKLKAEIEDLEKEAHQLKNKNSALITEKSANKEKIKELEKLHKDMEDTQKKLTDQLEAKERENKILQSSKDNTNDKLTQQIKDYEKVVAELQKVKAENESNREEEKKKKIIIGGAVLILFVISHLFANRGSLKKMGQKFFSKKEIGKRWERKINSIQATS